MKKKVIISVLVFIFVLSIVVIGKYAIGNEYFDKLAGYDKYLVFKVNQDITDRGFIVEVFDFLKLTDFINFCNSLPQRLDYFGLMYIISILMLGSRLYLQKLYNKYNIVNTFPILSIFCLVVYSIVSFTFTKDINLIELILIYILVLITINLIELITINSKASIIPKEDYNVLDEFNKPLYFAAMKRKKMHNLDMVFAGIVFITVKGILTIPIIYVVFASLPYCIYALYKIEVKKRTIELHKAN